MNHDGMRLLIVGILSRAFRDAEEIGLHGVPKRDTEDVVQSAREFLRSEWALDLAETVGLVDVLEMYLDAAKRGEGRTVLRV